MITDQNNETTFLQNLMDAGCDEQTIQQCLCYFQAKKLAEILQTLAAHRAALLDTIHSDQEKIDCIDYLIYNTKKELGKGEKDNDSV